jgi:hypothetical protein
MGSTRAVANAEAAAAKQISRARDAYVPTPADLAETLTGWPYMKLGDPSGQAWAGPEVLEPSAGAGILARWILEADRDAQVTAIEPDDTRRAAIAATVAAGLDADDEPILLDRRRAAVHTVAGTFEDWAALYPDSRYDAVVMNPPWSLPGQPRTWVTHVLTAWAMLRPGGRLVAVVPPTGRAPGRDGNRLAALVEVHGGTDNYAADQAAVRAGFPPKVGILWLVKPMATVDGRPSWLLNPAAGNPPNAPYLLDVTPRGAEAAPVQRYTSWAHGTQPRIVRYAGTCHGCARLLWAHDDGAEDALSWTVGNSVNPPQGMTGPTVGLCMECGSYSERYDAAVAAGAPHWTPAPDAASPIEDGSASGATVVAWTTYGQPVIVAHVTRVDLPAPEPAAVAPTPAPASVRRLVARRIPEVGSAVYDADTGEKVSPAGNAWWPNLRRARQALAEMRDTAPAAVASVEPAPAPAAVPVIPSGWGSLEQLELIPS